MKLYIGGRSQGKTEQVLKNEVLDAIVDEENYVNLFSEEYNGKKILINHFHLIIRDMIYRDYEEQSISEFVLRIMNEIPDAVIISDEIGNGIVPMEKKERLYRDVTGHMLIKIAENSDTVTRIICGIPRVIK